MALEIVESLSHERVRRIEFHSARKHESWLNIAENELRSLMQ